MVWFTNGWLFNEALGSKDDEWAWLMSQAVFDCDTENRAFLE